MSEHFNLERFKAAQDVCYHRVKAELSAGRKSSHWIWFIFPQLKGLGHSQMDATYAIQSQDEAKAYLADTLLGGRLNECVSLLLSIATDDIKSVMSHPDDIKLRSSMTLFAAIADDPEPFRQVLSKYYQGKTDRMTLSQLVYPV